MRHVGVLLLMVGLSVGLFLYWPAKITRSGQAETAWSQHVQPKATNSPGAVPVVLPRFSPDVALNWPVSAKRGDANPSTVDHRRETASKAATPVAPSAVRDWQNSTTDVSGSVSPRSGTAQLHAKAPGNRYELVAELQRHLKVRGCYGGRIDGSWGAGSRSAMQAYLERINAALPLNEPDHVLLTLLQTNDTQRCAACPAGQVSTIGGRCTQETVYASEQRRTGRTNGRELGGAEFQERMAIGGPTDMLPPSTNEDAWLSDDADASDYAFDDGDPSEPDLTGPDRQEFAGSKRQSRSVQAARDRNLMLGLGGGF